MDIDEKDAAMSLETSAMLQQQQQQQPPPSQQHRDHHQHEQHSYFPQSSDNNGVGGGVPVISGSAAGTTAAGGAELPPLPSTPQSPPVSYSRLSSTDLNLTPGGHDEDETYDDFDLDLDEIPDFSMSALRPGSELESPGTVSEGQRSLGLTSSMSERSERSDNSRTVLLPAASSTAGAGGGMRGGDKSSSKSQQRPYHDNAGYGNNKNKKKKKKKGATTNRRGYDDDDDNESDDERKRLAVVVSSSGGGRSNGRDIIGGVDDNDDEGDEDDDDDDVKKNDRSISLSDESKNKCGLGIISPPCFKVCANVKMFVFFMCVLQVTATALTTGYLNSVITTIEKRFEIGSSISGLIAAAYEFGNLVAVIFVSYLGANRHIPKWIGSGVILMGVGSLLFSLPHIIAPKYTIRSGVSMNETEDDNICRGHHHHHGGASGGGAGGGSDQALCISENSGNWGYVLVLVAAQVLIGTGGTPIMTLGVTYVDSHVIKEKSPTYLAFIHASGALGPVLGYALGALLLQYYVDTFTHDVQITPSSPRWIGAWWGGFIICGLLLISLSLPFLAYPRVLVKEKRAILESKSASQQKEEEAHAQEAEGYGRSVREIPRAVMHLLRNPVYGILLPAICCEICIVSGFVVFLPKYLESQFGTSTSMANLFTGGIGIPGAVLGILIGGYIMKKLSLTPKGAVQFVLLLNTLAISGFSFFFFLGCDNLKIAGANFPYFNSTGHKIFEANLTSSCNQNCACSPNHIQPICGINGITYFSPCHAGCTGANPFYAPGKDERAFNYSGCSCIREGPITHSSLEVIISPLATSGACKNRCEKLLPFLILLVGMTFCVAGTQMPLLMVTLRSVSVMERSFALGLQFVCMRLFAYIPSPIFFGQAIDQACLLWSQKCGRNGSCLLYDIVQFRFSYVGIAAGLKVISLVFFVALWFIIRKRSLDEDIEQEVSPPRMSDNVEANKDDHAHNALNFPRGGGGGGQVPALPPPIEGDNPKAGGDTPLRPSHLPIPIYGNNQNPTGEHHHHHHHPPPRISHSAPSGQPVMDKPGQPLSHSLFSDRDPDPHQEVMVMTPGSSNLQSLPPMTATPTSSIFNEESVL